VTESGDAALAELDVVRALLLECSGTAHDGVVDATLLHRTERAIVAAVAALAPSRQEAAPAREAAVAGAAPRGELPLARDLLITVDLMRHGLGA
jgi:hypothetical protein